MTSSTELKEGDLVVFKRHNSYGGRFYGEEGDVVTLKKRYDSGSFFISGLPEFCSDGLRRHVGDGFIVVAYTRDLEKLEPTDVGDLEDDY